MEPPVQLCQSLFLTTTDTIYNMLINTIIVDNEIACIKSLCLDLASYPEIKVIDTITSPEKAKKVIVKEQPSLLFLDVEMPSMTGIELLREIQPQLHSKICVVFYSAFDKYMIDALRSSAFDYLLKPYQPEELRSIIDRVKEKLKNGNTNFELSIRRLLDDDRKFALQTITGLVLLRRSDILYFQYFNEGRYWLLTQTNMTTYKLRLNTTAKEILSIGPSCIQISQDRILNIDYLSSIENKTYRCTLYPPFNNIELYASRRYYSKIKDALEII